MKKMTSSKKLSCKHTEKEEEETILYIVFSIFELEKLGKRWLVLKKGGVTPPPPSLLLPKAFFKLYNDDI
jgi:hypothetical protein